MTPRRINALILVLLGFVLLTALQASVEVRRANKAVDQTREVLANAQATLNVSDRLLAIDPQNATIRIRLEHAPMGLIVCLTVNQHEHCRTSKDWSDWVAAHADPVDEAVQWAK